MEMSLELGDGFNRFQLFILIGDLVVCARSLHTYGAHGGLFCSGAGSGSSGVLLAVPACSTAALVAARGPNVKGSNSVGDLADLGGEPLVSACGFG